MPTVSAPALMKRIGAFLFDRSGVAAIEFGLLAPLLLLMTFGTVEISRALIVNMRFQRATAMVGDLVTRETQLWPDSEADASVTTADAKATLAGIMLSVAHVMAPFSSSTLTLRVYQVWASASDPTQTKIEWSYQYPSQATIGCGTSKTINSGLLTGNGRAVYVEAQYTYTPFLTNLLPGIIGPMTWSDTMVMTPRDVPSVMYLPGLNNNNTWASPSTAACN